MKIIKNLKKLSYVFYFFTGLTPIVFLFATINADGGFPDSVGFMFTIFGIVFLFLGFVFSSIASVINKKLKNQLPDLPNDISDYIEPKKSSKKMFRIGFAAFIGVGLMLVGSVLIFWDGSGDNLKMPFLILLVILILVGAVSWILAIIRYFKK